MKTLYSVCAKTTKQIDVKNGYIKQYEDVLILFRNDVMVKTWLIGNDGSKLQFVTIIEPEFLGHFHIATVTVDDNVFEQYIDSTGHAFCITEQEAGERVKKLKLSRYGFRVGDTVKPIGGSATEIISIDWINDEPVYVLDNRYRRYAKDLKHVYKSNRQLKPCASQGCIVKRFASCFEAGDPERKRWFCPSCHKSFHIGCPDGCHDDTPYADYCDDCWTKSVEQEP